VTYMEKGRVAGRQCSWHVGLPHPSSNRKHAWCDCELHGHPEVSAHCLKRERALLCVLQDVHQSGVDALVGAEAPK
jgi:hypothetical protein